MAEGWCTSMLVPSLAGQTPHGQAWVCALTLTLYVRWFSSQGRTKVNKLLLRPVTSVEALQVGCPLRVEAALR